MVALVHKDELFFYCYSLFIKYKCFIDDRSRYVANFNHEIRESDSCAQRAHGL